MTIIPQLCRLYMTIIPKSPDLPFFLSEIWSCVTRGKSLYLQLVKNGCFERAGTVKIGGATPSKYGFVF